jgi:hypothetical protein
MSERGWMEPIVERVVAEVLESHTLQLQQEIVRRVLEELNAAPEGSEPVTSPVQPHELSKRVAEIQTGTNQKEILRALLEGCSQFAPRAALFVVKGGTATGWQARGFKNNDAAKEFALSADVPAVQRAIQDHVVVTASADDFDARFVEEFGSPQGELRLLPLVLKEKVAALVYADGGTDGSSTLDPDSLEVLVFAASAWLEINSLRKQTRKEGSAEPVADRPPAPMASASAPAFNDPFASHAPTHAMAAAASAEASVAAPVVSTAVKTEPVREAEPVITEPTPAAEVPAPTPDVSPEDQEVHQKAQRFARLLVDEVKLYNQAKVAEGRKNKDLYDRLKEAIEKSRSTYQKRYGNTVAAGGNYFQHELVRSLAEDDISIMGSNFPQ